jgi:predicted O-methyltransferase YrrM
MKSGRRSAVSCRIRRPELVARKPAAETLRDETARLPQAGMQISAHQGQQIALLVRAIGARRAVEVGTFTGYSALCVAEALPSDGKLWCCDVSEEWTRIADATGRRRAWREDRAHHRPGAGHARPAAGTGLAAQLDMAFIDANKNDYDAYYERCLALLRPGGLVLIDNVLWGGSVVDRADKTVDTGRSARSTPSSTPMRGSISPCSRSAMAWPARSSARPRRWHAEPYSWRDDPSIPASPTTGRS